MVTVKILDEEYNIKDEWDEITLQEFVRLQEICDKAPKKLKDIMLLILEGKADEVSEIKLTEREEFKVFPKFYGDILKELSDIPKNVINVIDLDSRRVFFYEYLLKFSISCLYYPMDIPEITKDYFEFKSENEVVNGKYILPKAKKVLGEDRLMGFISTVQFTEASDLDVYMRSLDKKNYSVLANIVSILCVKEGEEYDEDISLKRAEEFKTLTMDVVWDVFFYLSELLNLYGDYILSSSKEAIRQSMHQLVKQSD